ncbi:MAG: prolyl oligopeptidase family serine peptidase [Candidatus Eisenbacteria bacterium]|uniref:Prolyl oligopeptidase family serine peptidase n=1 Tax=Eiseniibacteriota bacterium TaxID=2212470 RepID=A0A7Y2H1X9_UNCEI|nr:prolyl oligopeptidase family serine peptidase [Candidatus Eisenbacteria bacterium]
MKHVLVLMAALMLMTSVGAAVAELPPIIDRELFFGDPEISGAQLSPDGKYISFIKPYKDVRNVWVKGIDEDFEDARPITADDAPVPGYFWSQDGRFILYVQDKGGNEDFHVYSVDPQGKANADSGVPEARDLTPIDGVRAVIYSVPENSPGDLIVGINDRNAMYHDVYRVDIATGERELMILNEKEIGFFMFDLEGEARLAYKQTGDGGAELLRIDGDELVPIYTTTYLEQAFPVQFHKNGTHCYIVTNKGDDVDLSRLMLMDVATGETELIETDPENEVDFGNAVFAADTNELIATVYIGDRSRVYPRDDKIAKDIERVRKNLPDGNLGWNSTTKDMRYHLISVSSDVIPSETYLYDRETGKFTLQYRSRPDLPSEHLAVMKPIRYKSKDGLEIPAYLTLPRGIPAKNLPLVVHPHGGPWARDFWGYDGYAQYLANRGYAVLQPNFRSSTGYGKNFQNAGNKEWGKGLMQHDITWGVKHLVDEGIVDPERVGIFGGSYGGYATLAGVTFTPDMYAAAIPYVAPSSLITLIESFPAYWRPFLKGTWFTRVGDPDVAADREYLEEQSPLNYVDQIETPLLVVHGANDPRVKQAESDQIVVALLEKGHDVEYIVAPDEGHGFRAPNNRAALAVAMERFLSKHLGGRYQESVLEETTKRLEEITVDVNSVTLPDASEKELMANAETAPLPAADGGKLEELSYAYDMSLEMGAQTMEMEMSRVLEEVKVDGKSVWRITDVAKTPMGTMTDEFDVDKKTLKPLQRKMGGMGDMQLTYSDDAIVGNMKGMGQSTDINIDLKAPVLGDGPGLVIALAGLPLAKGYSTVMRTLDAQTQKVRPFKLEVSDSETVTVPAGSFETFVIDLTPLDGDPSGTAIIHVTQTAPHNVVRGKYKMPAMMGGGWLTTQLSSTDAELADGDEE